MTKQNDARVISMLHQDKLNQAKSLFTSGLSIMNKIIRKILVKLSISEDRSNQVEKSS